MTFTTVKDLVDVISIVSEDLGFFTSHFDGH